MADILRNFAYSTVATAPSPALSGTSLVVQPGDGTKLSVGNAIAWPANVQPSVANAEIVRITVVATDTLTITRTQESSTNQSIAIGWQIQQGVTAGLLAQYTALSATPGGDLAGAGSTYATPALAAVGTAATVGDANHYPVVTTDAKGRVTGMTATALPAGVSPATTVTGPDAYGAAAAVGTGTNYARQDHDHGLPAAPVVPAAATTVTGPDAFGAAAVVGVGTPYARSDHNHGLPAAPVVPSAATTVTGPDAFGAVAAVGTGTAFARNDHDHGLPAAPAGGTPAISVTGPDAYGAAAAVGTGTNYARQDHDHGLPAAPVVPAAATTVTGPDAFGAAAVVGVGTPYARSDHNHGLPAAPVVPSAATTVTGPDAFGAVAAVGTGTAFARNDHDHGLPSIAAYAPLASPALTGAPTSPTAAALTNSTQVATTAYTDAAVTAYKTAVATETNKRITRRVLALSANSATPAVNTDNYDVVHITAQTATITGFTMTGTPVDGDALRISITGTAAVPFTLGASFEASTVALSTTTTGTARLDMGFFWNSATSLWRQVAVA